MRVLPLLSAFWLALAPAPPAPQRDVRFETQQIRDDFGVGYAVAVGDVNGDKKPDILAINGTQLLWFENPSWQAHVDARRPDAEGQRQAGAARHRSRRPPRRGSGRQLEAERHERRRHAPLGLAGRRRRPSWTLRDVTPSRRCIASAGRTSMAPAIPSWSSRRCTAAARKRPEWHGVGPRLLALRCRKSRRRIRGRPRSSTTRCTSSTTSAGARLRRRRRRRGDGRQPRGRAPARARRRETAAGRRRASATSMPAR